MGTQGPVGSATDLLWATAQREALSPADLLLNSSPSSLKTPYQGSSLLGSPEPYFFQNKRGFQGGGQP